MTVTSGLKATLPVGPRRSVIFALVFHLHAIPDPLPFSLVMLCRRMLMVAASCAAVPEGKDGVPMTPIPTSFRLGSGASMVRSMDWDTTSRSTSDLDNPLSTNDLVDPLLKTMAIVLGPIAFLGILCLMMPTGMPNLTNGNVQTSNNRDFNYRIPPAWSPENENNYSFRAYMTDIAIWVMLTDLQFHQQCAAIVMRRGGSARELARMISPQEMMNGGMQNGAMLDTVSFLLSALHARFMALEEESRLTAMTEMLAFARRPGESINSLLARYDAVRNRAATEGQFVMSVEGCALQILRSVGIGAQHLFTLLQPFQGQLPRDEAQYTQLITQLRRYGHISEGSVGNIASSLHGLFRQARPGSYLTDQTALR